MAKQHWIADLNDAFDSAYQGFLGESSDKLARNILLLAVAGAILEFDIVSLSKITIQGISIEDTKQDGIIFALACLQSYFVIRFFLDGLSDWKSSKYRNLIYQADAVSVGNVAWKEYDQRLADYYKLIDESRDQIQMREEKHGLLSSEDFQKYCDEDGWEETYEKMKVGPKADIYVARAKFITEFLNSTKRFRLASFLLRFAFTIAVGLGSIILFALPNIP